LHTKKEKICIYPSVKKPKSEGSGNGKPSPRKQNSSSELDSSNIEIAR